ncbi:hypothetical protein SEA_PARADIDDLES_115 [Streptomyces phage Paradiddles]|uniref:Uncharacterized protein n=2 Tax=Samistivirus TaxID=2560220 RepID=A0A514U1Z7_9CAUD|nr:hypothetical protein FDI37_gp143 [Streptomyces phage Paradiddles]YP_010104004.1 hypothetical protein KNU71_gp152 [Streptomyces phage Braelyn]ASR77588.1 hypothetical protein SEA_PARADIDDLES_115 [Streptomyces phage Paradiddles]QDK02967.1 hypothetical protein SEA_BRAELYN_120 [Streptomyces phage Braelyn]UGL63110.1 hypothetical protein SEA_BARTHOLOMUNE_119 [Streptomyces phage Bartholomune]
MKWYRVVLQSWRGNYRSAYHGDQHGTSLADAKRRVELSFQRNGWLDDEVTKFSIELEFDEKRTKHFDDNDLWGPYI